MLSGSLLGSASTIFASPNADLDLKMTSTLVQAAVDGNELHNEQYIQGTSKATKVSSNSGTNITNRQLGAKVVIDGQTQQFDQQNGSTLVVTPSPCYAVSE